MAAEAYILGPTVRRRPFEGAEFFVRIADDLRKAVIFLGPSSSKEKPEFVPKGTGFFVTWQSDSERPIPDMVPECGGHYLITAKHNAEFLQGEFRIRFNKKGGGSGNELIEDVRWYTHPDPSVDVAVLHCGYPDWADCIPIDGTYFERISQHQEDAWNELGIGDVAYVVGLFNRVAGKTVNLPVLHTGHIALLPRDEKIPIINIVTKEPEEVEGYLVEAHGLDGLSGSPVFARISYPVYAKYRAETVPPARGGEQPGRMHGITVFIGLWSGSWARELAGGGKPPLGKVPLGMGIVVPSYKISEILNGEELVEQRLGEYERRLRENAAKMDMIHTEEKAGNDDTNPHHREDFKRLLDAAVKKPKQGDQT